VKQKMFDTNPKKKKPLQKEEAFQYQEPSNKKCLTPLQKKPSFQAALFVPGAVKQKMFDSASKKTFLSSSAFCTRSRQTKNV